MKLIQLTQGFSAKVDDDVFDFLSQRKWYYNDGYAGCKDNSGPKQKHILMHRVILHAPKGIDVDHKNGDTLDNRRENLRFCTRSTNAMNMRKHKGSSIYKGVCKDGDLWRVQIWKDNKKVFTARTKEERWAGMIYDLNAPALFGEYARLNFPEVILVVRE